MRRHPWLTALAVFIAVGVAVFCGFEWYVEQRWQHYAAEARARGVKLQWAELGRPEIPAEQNFAELPMLKTAFAKEGSEPPFKLPKWRRPAPATATRPASTYEDIPPVLANVAKGDRINWKDWQDYFQAVGFLTEITADPARDVLRATEHYAPQFQQWSEWRTTRRQCQFPLQLEQGHGLPANLFMHAAMMFNLRLSAHLAVGDPAAAYADFQDGWQAFHALQNAPSMVNGLLRVGMLRFLVEAMADGLRDHGWTDVELKKIETDLAALRLADDYREDMEASRREVNAAIEKLMNTSVRERMGMRGSFGFLGSRPAIVYVLLPRSVFRNNELRLNQYLDELTARSGPDSTFELDRETPSSSAYLTGSYDKEYYFFNDAIGDAYVLPEKQYIHLQILVDQARLAGALERFHLVRGAYPADLAELVPEFIPALPIDIYARASYRYQPEGGASYQLYSVGEDRKDDGGAATPAQRGWPPRDIVWPFSHPRPERQ